MIMENFRYLAHDIQKILSIEVWTIRRFGAHQSAQGNAIDVVGYASSH